MPITPDLPFPKSAGDSIRSKDWNDLVNETKRLDTAKVDRAGFLTETTSPDALHYVGFGREIEAAEAREAFVALTREARAKVSG